VKRDLFSLQFTRQFLDGIEGGLIRDPPRYVFVTLNLGVDLNALLAHRRSRIRALSLSLYDDRGPDLFIFVN
jgi:hypothetical protein